MLVPDFPRILASDLVLVPKSGDLGPLRKKIKFTPPHTHTPWRLVTSRVIWLAKRSRMRTMVVVPFVPSVPLVPSVPVVPSVPQICFVSP